MGTTVLYVEWAFILSQINIARPAPPLIDESGLISTLIFYMHQYLQETETITQHKNITCTVKFFGKSQY